MQGESVVAKVNNQPVKRQDYGGQGQTRAVDQKLLIEPLSLSNKPGYETEQGKFGLM